MTHEETLDPENWDKLRKLGYVMLDDMLDYLRAIRKRPVWQAIPERVKTTLKAGVPLKGQNLEKIYEEFKALILPYPLGNIHPRFWGWVTGTGIPSAILAEMLASTLNSNQGGGEHAANYVERQVIDWIKEVLGYPRDSSGILVSGCSMANLIGLAIARNTKAGYDLMEKGLQAAETPLVFYGSREMHISIDKAVQLLGLGCNALRKIPVNNRYEIKTDALRETIKADIAAGYKPACVIANIGTVNTGAVDNLRVLTEIANEFDVWLHVDGAFGVWCGLSSTLKSVVDGLEQADSIAFDLHKWMYIQYEAGCVLVKNREAHLQSFSLVPEYLTHQVRGTGGGEPWYSDYGLQLSRGNRALKIWMCIKEHGFEKFGRLIEQNIRQARYLTTLIEKEKNLELLAPTSMNIVNFRYNNGHDEETLNMLNEEIVLRLQETGVAVLSGTRLKGKYAIRLAIVNHRSRKEDFELLVREILKLGANL
ncbi:MAG: pyridoxal phosphate-dependent decarboxylase family protein [Candidatus Ranarchaeia archaeon]